MARTAHEGRGRRIRRLLARVVGLTATAALLAVGVAIVLMVSGGREDSKLTPSQAAAASPEKRADKARAKPRKPALTKRARASRRAAAEAVRAQGYTPVSLATWKPGRTLQALVAAPSGDRDGGRRVFFFVGRTALGTDFQQPSARVSVAGARGARAMTLVYRLYDADDAACCPAGERFQIRYRYNGETVSPEGLLPDPLMRIAR